MRKIGCILFVAMLSLLILTSVSASASDADEASQAIIDAAHEIAKENNYNPITVYTGKDGKNYQSGMLNIRDGRQTLIDGDMLINATRGPLTVGEVEIKRGEYVHIKDGNPIKGEIKIDN